jgi:hypothetical protein
VVTLTAERDSLELRRVEMDRQLELSGVKIRDNRMRMNRIRNSTELLALQREIDLSKEANSQTEDELIRVMETLEVLAAQLTAAQEVLQTIESQAAETVAERRARLPPSGRRSRPRSARATSSPAVWIRNCAQVRDDLRSARRQRGGRGGGRHLHRLPHAHPPQFYNELLKFPATSASARTVTASCSGARRWKRPRRRSAGGAAPAAPERRLVHRDQTPRERRPPALVSAAAHS